MSQVRKTGLFRGIDPSFLIAAALTTLLYVVVHQPAMNGTLLRLYTTEHAVDYVIVALFVWGLTDISLKLLAFPKQFMALRQDWIAPRKGREPASAAATLLERVLMQPAWLRDTKIGRRFTKALEYVAERNSAEDYREYLQYLSEENDHATHSNYMLVRFVIGVTPLLGFLGTVVHFGTALSGISFEEMTRRLPVIVSEMGAAFNTTTVALGAAMTMTVCLFICERIERSIDRTVDRMVDHELLHRFAAKDPNITPLLASIQTASEDALLQIGEHLKRQAETWAAALDGLFARFDQRHEAEATAWTAALEALQRRHEDYELEREERLAKFETGVADRHDQHLEQIREALTRALALRDDFGGLLEALREIAQGEGRLADLQGVLTQNLRSLHDANQFEDALHGLTAAIHLLTARHGGNGGLAAAA